MSDIETVNDRIAAMLANLSVMSPEQMAEREREAAERAERQAKQDRARRRAETLRELATLPVAREMLEPIVDGSIGDTQAITIVRTWFDTKSKPVLLLLGGVGCGKTIAAAWLLARYTMSGTDREGAYVKMRDLANLYRAGFGEDASKCAELMRSGLLVIDELTTERDAELGRAALHEVIDERGSRRKPTLLLANRTKDEIRDRYDARTIDRLRECASVMTVGAKSMRKGAAW